MILKIKNEVLATIMAAVILVSTLFVSLPLVRADYTVDHASFPPDLPGDVNNDGKVNLLDYFKVALAYGSSFANRFGSPKWNALCDVNDDGKVNLIDVVKVQMLYGIPPYDTSDHPIAYSTSFEFDVPNTNVSRVWYYILARIYLPAGLASNWCFLNGSSDAGIRNVINDTVLVRADQPSGPFNITLGNVARGYHLLELECLGPAGGGSIGFSVFTSASEAVWLDRFRICVPNYGSSMIGYTVKTYTQFNDDDFFLGGIADKFIDNVWLGGKSLWPDWMWDTGTVSGGVGAIYGWGDGFMYPLGTPGAGMHAISFAYGNNATGLLDFHYISRSNQSAEIGPPKFYASASISNLGDAMTVNSTRIYGGSQWASKPGVSKRNSTILTKCDINYNSSSSGIWFNTVLDVEVGNWWATWELGANQPADVAIPLNFTVENLTSNIWTGQQLDTLSFWDAELRDYTIDTYSFASLGIKGMEANEGQSKGIIIPQGHTIALNFAGTTIMTTTAFSSVYGVPEVGAAVGLGVTGVAAILDYIQGQQVSAYDETFKENNHWQLTANGPIYLSIDTNSTNSKSKSDLVFLKFQTPDSGYDCGLTEVVLKGSLGVSYNIVPSSEQPISVDYPIGDIQIILCIPWFIWSQT
jgi:hypothetical protein